MWVVAHVLPSGIIRDVKKLSSEVAFFADAVLMITRVPDVTGVHVFRSEGIAAFDELNAACGADVD